MCGQALVELAVTLPVLLLLFSGLLDIGRAYYFEVEASDASRDVARVASAYSFDSGVQSVPSDGAICTEAKADLTNFGSVSCQFTATGPPFTAPPSMAPGSAVVVVMPASGTHCTLGDFCRDTSTLPSPPIHGTVTVAVYYSFSPVTPAIGQIVPGGRILIQDQAQMVSAW